MDEQGQVVVIEQRGALRLACLEGGGEKRVRVQLREGSHSRQLRQRLLHVFDQRFEPGPQWFEDLDAWVAQCRQLNTNKEPLRIDRELLWQSLQDSQEYSLSELCEIYFGSVYDEALLAIVDAFAERTSDFTFNNGKLHRVDEETRQRIRQRLLEEARIREENQRFKEWFEESPRGTPSDEVETILEAFKQYALSGADGSPRRIRQLASELGYKHSDELLVWLCQEQFLPHDVNEYPARLGLRAQHSMASQQQSRSLLADIHAFDKGEGALVEAWSARQAFSEFFTFTIDQPSTRDVDDAISIRAEGDDTLLAVHICDVASLIDLGSPLDEEAQERATTVYFEDHNYPMLPDELVIDGLSLNPGKARPALSLCARFDKDFKLIDEPEFVAGLVTVDARLSYRQSSEAPWADHAALQRALDLAKALRRKRQDEGAMIGVNRELRVKVEHENVQIECIRHTSPGHIIVSELMVFYNTWAAGRLAKGGAAAFFKVQPKACHDQFEQDRERFGEAIAQLRRRFPSTRMSVQPGPHRTIGAPSYVQCTAPIRRYTDLIAQRQINQLIRAEEPAYSTSELRSLLRDQERKLSKMRRAEDRRLRYWVHRSLECDPGPRHALVSRLQSDGRCWVHFPELSLEVPLSGLSKSLREDLPWSVGDELSVVATEFQPRARWTKIELFETNDESPE